MEFLSEFVVGIALKFFSVETLLKPGSDSNKRFKDLIFKIFVKVSQFFYFSNF